MRRALLPALLLLPLLAACVEADPDAHDHGDAEVYSSAEQAMIECSERTDTGYVRGNPFPITIVTVDGKPVERDTANAFWVMREAAAAQGVHIRVVSGFRTQSEQQYLYSCYVNCNCNSCNLAARPGFSNHQSGHALDLNTSDPGVYDWLSAHGGAYGFARTVPSERWHWEWWGGGPGGGPCGVCEPHCEGSVIVGRDCGRGDCGVFGSSCVDDALGPRCVFFACPAQGDASVCIDDRRIGTCHDGALTDQGDCGAFAAHCSTVGGPEGSGWMQGEARCVSVFCAESPTAPIYPHSGCFLDGEYYECNALGQIVNKAACPAGEQCTIFPEPRCAADVGCPPGDGVLPGSVEEFQAGITEICSGETVVGRCAEGALFEAIDCAETNEVCSSAGGQPRCVSRYCAEAPLTAHVVCLPDGALGHCAEDGALTAEDCPAGQRCIDGACAPDEEGLPPVHERELDCGDGLDNELDGLTDCEDDECASEPRCEVANPDGDVVGDGSGGDGDAAPGGAVETQEGCQTTPAARSPLAAVGALLLALATAWGLRRR